MRKVPASVFLFFLVLFLVGVILGLLTGCASDSPKVDPNQIAHDFYRQKRTYHAVKITNVSEMNLRGSNMTFALESPMPELRMMPSDPNTWHEALETAKNIALGGFGLYTLGKIATRDPVVVSQPEPLVVRPEVVNVGGGL